MRKLLTILLTILITISIAACTTRAIQNETNETIPTKEPWYATVPEEIPDPFVYTGTGDSFITIDTIEPRYIFYIEGNQAGERFIVKGYDESGNSTELFVATTDPYKGITLDPHQNTTKLKINATGDWKVEVRSAYTAHLISSGETLSGNGDDIIHIKGQATTATITGNEDENYFEVRAYYEQGDDILVSTTKKYSDTINLKNGTYALKFSAVGNWKITLN